MGVAAWMEVEHGDGRDRTTSKRLDRRFLCVRLLCRRKYFWAWLATCVGARVVTKCREMPRQSPFPSFSRPARNRRCSSSVHGTPGDGWNPDKKAKKSRVFSDLAQLKQAAEIGVLFYFIYGVYKLQSLIDPLMKFISKRVRHL